MWSLDVAIKYVDGRVLEFDASEWAHRCSHGVDHIQYPHFSQSGDSIYYLRPDRITFDGEMAWVAGSFSLFGDCCIEGVMRENGEVFCRERRADLPDLRHEQIKLGWWRTLNDPNQPAAD